MCLYGAKASWQKQTTSVEATNNLSNKILSCNVSCSSYHYLLICALAKSLLESLGSVSQTTILKRQRVHLILLTRHILLSRTRKCITHVSVKWGELLTCSDSLIFSNSSSRDFLCCSWAIFKSNASKYILLPLLSKGAKKSNRFYIWCLLFTVLACSSCRVASVSLWAVSISIKDASWFSLISSIWGQDLDSQSQRLIDAYTLGVL